MSWYTGLPGILSQSGEKYTWNRYSIAYTETAGSSATVSRTYNYSKKAASAYTRSGTTFTLTNPTSTTFENITAGKYLVNVANSSSTATSGTTLYKVTNNAGRTMEAVAGSSSSNVKAIYYNCYGTNSYSTSATSDSVTFSTPTTYTITSLSANQTFLSPYSDPTRSWSLVTVSTWYEHKVETIYGSYIAFTTTSYTRTPGSTLNLTYTPYTAVESVGTLIDTVRNNDISAYPTNGIQDGYWYILQS